MSKGVRGFHSLEIRVVKEVVQRKEQLRTTGFYFADREYLDWRHIKVIDACLGGKDILGRVADGEFGLGEAAAYSLACLIRLRKGSYSC